jgi:hypothetical protein
MKLYNITPEGHTFTLEMDLNGAVLFYFGNDNRALLQ